MRWITVCALLVLVWTGPAGRAAAQTSQPSTADLLRELRRMNDRIEALEARHRREREADKAHIRRLEEQVRTLGNSVIERQRAEEIKTIRAEAPQQTATPNLFDLSGASTGGRNLLNPDVTVFVDLGGSVSSRGRNKALNRFNLREAELDLRAAISPAADGVFILTLGEEIESEATGDVSIRRDVDIEESYVNLHSLPYDLALKLGRFRTAFGRSNLLHTHDLPQVTRPLAVQSFLGPEGLISTGASLSWLVPNPWDKYVELTAEVVNSDGGAESPILGGPNADNPAVVAHVKYFDDLTETSSIELGTSYLYARTDADLDFDANVFGLDASWQWTDPDPSKFRSFLWQTEAFWAKNDIRSDLFSPRRNNSFGFYTFGQYQLSRDWYTGLRFDYTEFPNSESRGLEDRDFALSPYVTWYISEFLRLRAGYEHRRFRVNSDVNDEDAVFLQMTAVIGAHPPHPYWVNR